MRTNRIFILILLSVSVLSMFSCSLLSKKYEKKEDEEFKISAVNKTKIDLTNVNGKITVSKGDSLSGIVIKAEKIGYMRKKDMDKPLDMIKVNIDTTGNIVRITSELQKDHEWLHFDIHSNKVNYDIKVPPNIMVKVDNVNGDIELYNLVNETDISSVNGEIKFDNLSGVQNLSTTNGKITGSIDSVRNFKVETVNGSVTLTLAKTFLGSIRAETVNGHIDTENLTISDPVAEKKLFRGYIGNKNNELSIDVVNGRITLTGSK